jgi:hypothetical protein
MSQYRPDHRVGVPTRREERPFGEIDRRPSSTELQQATAAARRAGLWRFDDRRPVSFPGEASG